MSKELSEERENGGEHGGGETALLHVCRKGSEFVGGQYLRARILLVSGSMALTFFDEIFKIKSLPLITS